MQRLAIKIEGVQPNDHPYPAVVDRLIFDGSIEVGDASGKANVIAHVNASISASGTLDVGFGGSVPSPLGDKALTRVNGLMFKAPPTNAGTISIEPGASNGWTGFGTDYLIPLAPGGCITIWSPAGITSSPTDWQLLLTNQSGAGASTVEIFVIGRDPA